MRINTNIWALKAYDTLFQTTKSMGSTQDKLSTGLRINSASDDPAGFILSRKLAVRADGFATANENIGTARNLLGVAEGGANNISRLMRDIRSNLLRAADDSLSIDERIEIQSIVEEIADEINQTVNTTRWGHQKLLDGTFQSKFFQAGPDYTDRSNIDISFSFYSEDMGIGQLGWETARHGNVENLSIDEGTGITSIEINDSDRSIAANGSYRIRTLNTAGTSREDANIVIDFDSNGYEKSGGTKWSKVINLNDLFKNEDKDSNNNGLSNNTIVLDGLKISFDLPDSSDSDNPVFDFIKSGKTTSFEILGAQTSRLDVSHHGNAIESLQSIESAIKRMNHMTAIIGAKSNRFLFSKENFLSIAETNVREAQSRLADADVAKEQLEAAKFQILQQTTMSLMAQSMYLPQGVLSLFQ